MRKKIAVVSIVVLAASSSVAFAGVPFYRHLKSNDDHKASDCEYSKVHDGKSDQNHDGDNNEQRDRNCD